jgi:hypothetical protein
MMVVLVQIMVQMVVGLGQLFLARALMGHLFLATAATTGDKGKYK